MDNDRLIDLLRALPPAPEVWVLHAQEIPSLASLEDDHAGSPDEGHADLEAGEDSLAADLDPSNLIQDHQAEDTSPDEPSGDVWLP